MNRNGISPVVGAMMIMVSLVALAVGVTIGATLARLRGTAPPTIVPPPVKPLPARVRQASAAERAVDLIWLRESTRGTAANLDIPGKAGELGEFQLTPIWIADCRELFGVQVNPFDDAQCREIIPRWLARRAPEAGAVTAEDMAEMFRLGPRGFRAWKAGG